MLLASELVLTLVVSALMLVPMLALAGVAAVRSSMRRAARSNGR